MDLAEFGRFLSQQRELRGLSREDVSKATKIPMTLIGALEDGQAERLPARVFVQNYVRGYAQVIGMAPEEALLRYEEIARATPGDPAPAALERGRRRRALATLLGLVVVAAAVGYALLAYTGRAPWPSVAR